MVWKKTSRKIKTYFVLCNTVMMAVLIIMQQLFVFNKHVFNEVFNSENIKNVSIKYILQWTKSDIAPFIYMGTGDHIFTKQHCKQAKCFVTSNKTFFSDTRQFDVVLFHGPEMIREWIVLPKARSLEQKYIFVSKESPHYYPVPKNRYNLFYNLTWTFKLNSDILYGYMVIRDKEGNIIGPRETTHWIEGKDMLPIDLKIINRLKKKSRAVAWLVSNCRALSGRQIFVEKLKKELSRYSLDLDIYGKCGEHKCGKGNKTCWDIIEERYFFYLSFENSFSEDYVTEKLLKPLQHYTVPIVFGAANYSRFMPDGIYLDAIKLGVDKLAAEIFDIVQKKEKYYSFFNWHNHYSYHDPQDAPDSSSYCNLCELLHKSNTGLLELNNKYMDFSAWWNSDLESVVMKNLH